METSPVTCPTLEEYYHIDGHTFEKQYKEVLSGFRTWDQLSHADEWLLFPDNIGPRLAIDESSLSNGELYTFVTNRDARTRECSLVAVVAGTKSEDVITVLKRIDESQRYAVKEVTLDLSDSMRKIVRSVFPKANRVIDRFHIQKLDCEAVQELPQFGIRKLQIMKEKVGSLINILYLYSCKSKQYKDIDYDYRIQSYRIILCH